MKNIAIIILAAGASTRFGSAKQLVQIDGKSLLEIALSVASDVSSNIVVVLGANASLIKNEIKNHHVFTIQNDNWEEGMSSSIRCGLSFLLKEKSFVDAAIIMVCDQPYVTSSLIKKMIATYQESKKLIVASAYNNTIGTPVLFDKLFFSPLLLLKGKNGAKKIVEENMDSAVTVSFPLGNIDIDTKEDYENLQHAKFNI